MVTEAPVRPPGTNPKTHTPAIWQMDYSQLELRIFASATKTKWMLETFADPDGDIHAATALNVLGIPKDRQTADIRTRAKTLNFGMAYGAQGATVEEQITVFALRNPDKHIEIPTLAECNEMVKLYWQRAPEAQEWKDYMIETFRDRGYAETLYGYRRYLPFIRSGNDSLRAGAEREGINHIIQGTAGQIIKQATLLIWEDAPLYFADVRSQIHDELFGLVWGDAETKRQWIEVVRRYAVLDQPLRNVPLKVEPKLVTNWKEAK
jgi:DNA polymerase-1